MIKIVFIFLITLVFTSSVFGQIDLEEKYVSLTVDSGYLNIKKPDMFLLCDYNAQKKYYGKWTINKDTLTLYFNRSASLKEKNAKAESHIEKLIVSGRSIKSLSDVSVNKRSYMTKSSWDVILKEQKALRKKKKVRAK